MCCLSWVLSTFTLVYLGCVLGEVCVLVTTVPELPFLGLCSARNPRTRVFCDPRDFLFHQSWIKILQCPVSLLLLLSKNTCNCFRSRMCLIQVQKDGKLRPNPHWTRARKFQRKSFDVGCVQCGHSHSYQRVPFACVARARPVWMRLPVVHSEAIISSQSSIETVFFTMN